MGLKKTDIMLKVCFCSFIINITAYRLLNDLLFPKTLPPSLAATAAFSHFLNSLLSNQLKKKKEKFFNKQRYITGPERIVPHSELTLLLTSFSLGRMSKVKPSACPRERLPPFMKLPKASTSPSTCSTGWLACRVWRGQPVSVPQSRFRISNCHCASVM